MENIKKLSGQLNPKLAKQIVMFLLADKFTYSDYIGNKDIVPKLHEGLLIFLNSKLSAISIKAILDLLGVSVETALLEHGIRKFQRFKKIDQIIELFIDMLTRETMGEHTLLLLQLLMNHWLFNNDYSLMVFDKFVKNNLNELIYDEAPLAVIKESFIRHYNHSYVKNEIFKLRTAEEIADEIISVEQTLKNQFKITRLAIFGSISKGEQNEFSDLDVYIETSDSAMLGQLDSVKDYLEAILQIRVDITAKKDFINYEMLEVF